LSVRESEGDGFHEHLERHPDEGARCHRPKGRTSLVRKGEKVDKVVHHFGHRVDPDGPRATAPKHHVQQPNSEEPHVVFNVCERA
jgi:hypothetical protein